MESQNNLNSQSNPEQREQIGCIALPNFKINNETMIIKPTWYCPILEPIEQNRAKPHAYIFEKVCIGKINSFKIDVWKNGKPHAVK